jgi:hypothetical protein
MEKESINGVMEDNIVDNGEIIKWKVEEFSHGQIIEDTKVNTMMIRKKAMVYSSGPTEEDMKESGRMASSMELECTQVLQASKEKVNGQRAKG